MEARYDSLSRDMSDPTLVNDQKKFQAIAKEHRDMEPIVEKYRQYRKVADGIAEAKAMLSDPDLKEMAEEELATLEPQLDPIAEELKVMLLPKDPNDDKNIVIELRAGTGGDEAALFVAEMFRMYLRFAEQHKWRVQVLSESETGIGNGLKEVTAIFEGDKVYSQMKYESGVHRVQRVPATETQGRVHTSAITVAVLPEAEEVDIKIEQKDLRIDTVVSCQDEKSQIKNREKAMRVLRSRLYEVAEEARHQAEAKARKQQVGTGDRSEKIRTYNFPQNRLTDHRIGYTNHNLNMVMEGQLQPTIDALIANDIAEKMKGEPVAA
jgi:peptide chain release factor 1